MTIRTFKQQGQAYGWQPVTVIAKIDGNEIFNAMIEALDQPPVALPVTGPFDSRDLFTWENSTDFQGSQEIEISVTGGTLILSDTVANYVRKPDPVTEWRVVLGGGGPDYYDNFYRYQASPDQTIFDPYSNVTINDVSALQQRNGVLVGQWFWKLNSGDVFKATLNVLAGVMPIS